jgi:hypothetical protein
MNLKSFILFSVLVLSPIAFSQKAEANEPKCKVSTNCLFGGRVSDRWVEGERAEKKADFDSARVAYTRALNAAETLNFPGQTEEYIKLARACAAVGSFARLQGAIVGGDYMNTHMMTKDHSESALKLSQEKFREVWDEKILESPELGSCP